MNYQLSGLAETTAHYINTTNQHIFLTGKAGTGKTTFLKHIVANTHKKTVVAAPTGIAAINANGVTLHSLLHLPFGAFIPERINPPNVNHQVTTLQNLFANAKFNGTKRAMLNEVELLIIDEVSMLRSDLLDCIDHMLRYVRRRTSEPFGGVQMLFIGDLLQLPPVVKDSEWRVLSEYYKSSYFFDAHVLKDHPPIHIEFDKIYRQSDEQFISILNRFRDNEQSQKDIEFLNGFYKPEAKENSEKGFIFLTTHNRKADEINEKRLKALKSEVVSFDSKIEGDFPENAYPTNQKLELKKGAQVMFIKNDQTGQGQYFNGKIGQISTLDKNEIWVKFEDGTEVPVSHYTWENKRYTLNQATNEIEEKVLGTFMQYPLKLAWAVTVHKSQGLTFEKAILDLTDAFTHGQVYVALSRLTSLKGLVLASRLPMENFERSDSMNSFMATKSEAQQLANQLPSHQKAYFAKLAENTFNFGGLIQTLTDHIQSFDKEENRSNKQQYLKWTQGLLEATLPLKKVGQIFSNEVQNILVQENYADQLTERAAKAKTYFSQEMDKLSAMIHEHEKEIGLKVRILAYQKELKKIEQSYFNKKSEITRFYLLVSNAQKGKSLNKNELYDSALLKNRVKELLPKKDKTPTAEISFGLYQQGKTVEEIAEARGMVPSTIEGHLTQYIISGQVDIKKLINEDKLKVILSLITPETTGTQEIKAQLGEEYSYGEIKMAIAYSKIMKA
ncbi:MAG: helicase [Cytophagales bacterium CG12_big_fil_rev_8_21_14_0_65_40_12]|nr:MAG: helicase [Cytophagales bacterium CG12_big_fil_rev_8_21_14_0_65_40_12]PIW03366.1 MAG: helicase [Cytophagales bacterium CG17_big_fil_post_rev_8_21_14_2_50_40_13]